MNRPLAAQGYVAIPPDAWELAAQSLLRTAAEWPEVCVVADLRWWVDQITARRQASLPTIRALGTRWGWSKRRVVGILAEPESWADPKRGGLDQAAAVLAVLESRAPKWKSGTGRDRIGTGRDRTDIENQPLAEANGTGSGQDGTGSGHTRAFPLSPGSQEDPHVEATPIPDPSSTPNGVDMSVEDPKPNEDPQPEATKAEQLALLGSPSPAAKPSKPAAWRVAIDLIGAHHRGTPLTPETWQTPITAAMKSTKCTPRELADAYAAVQDPRMRGYEWWRETFPNGGTTLFQAFIRSGGQKATQIAGFIEAGRAWRAKWADKSTSPAAEQAPPTPDKPPEETVSQAWLTVQASLRNGRKTDHLSPRTLRALELGWGSVSGALNLLYAADSYTETRVIRPQFESCYQRATA